MVMKRSRRIRSNGEGSIIQLPSGKWKALISIRGSNGKLKRRSKTCISKSDANIALREMLSEQESGNYFEPSTITLTQMFHHWLEDSIKGELSGNTYLNYQRISKKHITDRIGDVKLKDLSPRLIQSLLTDLKKADVGSATRQKTYNILNQALNNSVVLGDIQDNPCKRIQRPKHETRPANPLELEETKNILVHTKNSWYHALYYLAFATGMRQGEIFGLPWDAIDFSEKVIDVRQQLKEEDHKRFISDRLKNKYSRRKIVVADSCLDVLHNHRKRQLKKLGKQDLCFLTERGNTIRKNFFLVKKWHKVLEDLELEVRGFHQTRHTYATIQLLAGVPIHVVSRILGHANASTLLKTYAHILSGAQEKAADNIHELLG